MRIQSVFVRRFLLFSPSLIVLVLLTGCASTSATRQLGASISLKGQSVCTTAIDTYGLIEETAQTDKNQQDFAKIVTEPPQMPGLPNSKSGDFKKQLSPRIKAFRALRKSYEAFQRISESTFGSDVQAASQSLLDSTTALQGLPDISDQLRSVISGIAGRIAGQIQAGKIRKHNEVMRELAIAYRELWTEDAPIWSDYFQRVYGDYADRISSIPKEAFDEDAVDELVDDPFQSGFKIRLYKLRVRSDAQSQTLKVEEQVKDVSNALDLLVALHTELVKQKPSLQDVEETLGWINTFLKDKE